MRHRRKDGCTNEAFDAWMAAADRQEAVGALADEEGGPRLSLVATAERAAPAPTDLLPPAASSPVASDTAAPAGAPIADARTADTPSDTPETSAPAAEPFDGVALPDSRKRLAGWSADRQRMFLGVLAETGSVHLASDAARLSARSAYRLRTRSPAFAAAWDTAEQLAVGRLSALAFDRAIHGRTEQVWQEGELVLEKRVPSDRLLMWLLARLDPRRFAAPSEQGRDGADPQVAARLGFDGRLDALTDIAVE